MAQDGHPDNQQKSTDKVARLKELLFDDEAATLKGLSQRIDQVYERAGNDSQLQSSVARVLDAALIEAEKTKHDQVSRAMAPMVVKTVKAEFLNSQEDLVEALYPITGRMVKSYVATAMKDLVNEINRKLENNSFMLRIRSLATGRPAAELAITDSQRLQIEEVLLIRRGTGELIERWPDTRALSNTDIHLSGILTAINDFASHAFQHEGGSIRNFAVDDFSMFLRASPSFLLAAKCSGTSASGIEYIIDDEFLKLLERLKADHPAGIVDSTTHVDQLASTKQSLDSRIKTRFDEITAPLPFRPFKVLAGLVALLAIAGAGWWAYTSYEAAQTRMAAQRIVRSVPALKPDYLDLKVGYRGKSIKLSGLSPSPEATATLMAELAKQLPEVKSSQRLLSLPGTNTELENRIAMLTKTLTGMEAAAVQAALLRAIERSRLRLSTSAPAIAEASTDRASPARQTDAKKALALVEQSIRELTSYKGAVESAPPEPGALRDLSTPLAALEKRLAGVTTLLTGLIGATPPRANKRAHSGSPDNLTLLGEAIAAQTEKISALTVALAIPRPPPLTPRQRLQAWIRDNAIFFADDDRFRSVPSANRKCDELAPLIIAHDGLIRIVGYTDERGTQSRNDTLALRRAERVKVELIKRNVPASRLLTMGRATGPDLSPDTGAGSPNRRVQIELAFPDERAP